MKTHKPKTTKAICSAVAFLTLVLTALSTTQSVRATVLDLSGLDGTYRSSSTWYSGDGGTALNNNNSASKFLNPDAASSNAGGKPVLTADISGLAGASTFYFGGTIDLSGLSTGAGIWNAGGGGGDVTLGFNGGNFGSWDVWNTLTTRSNSSAGAWDGQVGSNWTLGTGFRHDSDTGVAINGGPLDFVLGLTLGANGDDTYNLWVGANANTATQGAADFTYSTGAWSGSYAGYLGLTEPSLVGLNVWLPSSGSLTTSHMFASDSWHAVQGGSGPAPSPIPEPSTYGMLFFGITGLLLVARMRGSCRI